MRYYWQYLNTIGSSDITTLIDNNVIVFYNNATLELPTNVSAWFSISIDHKLHSTPTKDTTCSPQLLTQRRLTVSLIVLTTVYYQCGWQTHGHCVGAGRQSWQRLIDRCQISTKHANGTGWYSICDRSFVLIDRKGLFANVFDYFLNCSIRMRSWDGIVPISVSDRFVLSLKVIVMDHFAVR